MRDEFEVSAAELRRKPQPIRVRLQRSFARLPNRAAIVSPNVSLEPLPKRVGPADAFGVSLVSIRRLTLIPVANHESFLVEY